MSGEPVEGERPEEDFEIIEIDVTPHLTAEQRSWPVGVGQRPEEEFAIEEPLPALAVHGPDGRLDALLGILSEQEEALGGGGLQVSPGAPPGPTVTLIPRRAEGARERFERLARWAAAFGSDEVAVRVL